MAKNCGDWGKDKARERYAEGGKVPLPPRDPRKIAPDKKGQINIGSGSGYNSGGKIPSASDLANNQEMNKALKREPEHWQGIQDTPSDRFGSVATPSGGQGYGPRGGNRGGFKDGGPVESPPLVPSEWPPHPIRPKGKK